MARGSRLHTVAEAGLDLELKIRGQTYAIHPSLPDVLRYEGMLGEILAAAKGSETAPPIPDYERDARIADAAFTYLGKPHGDLIRALPPPMQSDVCAQLLAWFRAQAPTGEVSAPDPSSGSGGLPEAVANGEAAWRASMPTPSTVGSAP